MPSDSTEAARAAAATPAARHAYIRLFDDPGGGPGPLAHWPVAVKDLFDVRGQVTTAGSRVLAGAPPAACDSAAVARLRAAGAALVGHSNMTEFAFSGLGLNPHHGTPANPVAARLDPGTRRIPGGSTSGGAVAVAAGAARVALGSDTGGSIRIPAALHGLVGYKNTQRLTPLAGTVPLSTSLDTACAITRDVADAIRVHEVLAQRRVALAPKPLSALRLAVPTTLMLDALDATVAAAFQRSLAALSRAGAQVCEIELEPLTQLPALTAGGGLTAAEAYAWHRHRLERDEASYDPRVAARIRRGAALSAADYIDLLDRRRSWIAAVEARIGGFDALLSPTVPVIAPPLAPLVADDALYTAANLLMLRNPSVVNLLDGCALSLPCHREGDWPVGLMLWHAALHDDELLGTAQSIEALLRAGAA